MGESANPTRPSVEICLFFADFFARIFSIRNTKYSPVSTLMTQIVTFALCAQPRHDQESKTRLLSAQIESLAADAPFRNDVQKFVIHAQKFMFRCKVRFPSLRAWGVFKIIIIVMIIAVQILNLLTHFTTGQQDTQKQAGN